MFQNILLITYLGRCDVYPWPKPEALVGFWPLDSDSEMNNIASDQSPSHSNGTLFSGLGPFGEHNSSFTKEPKGGFLFRLGKMALPETFTISCYLLPNNSDEGAIIQFYKNKDLKYRLKRFWREQ